MGQIAICLLLSERERILCSQDKFFCLFAQVHFKAGKDRGKKILKKIKDIASGGKKKVIPEYSSFTETTG